MLQNFKMLRTEYTRTIANLAVFYILGIYKVSFVLLIGQQN